VLCGETAQAIAAAWLNASCENLLCKNHVGIASDKAHQMSITLARTVQISATPSRQEPAFAGMFGQFVLSKMQFNVAGALAKPDQLHSRDAPRKK
jgi:hypothetical protein